MTLTVRSATVNGATTKGSALTHAELDENWNHVANFTPFGSGAVAESVQAALRRLPHSAQYSSTANFRTVRAGLSGVQGVASTAELANVDTTVTTPGVIKYGGATFNSVYDPVLYFGYNLDGQSASSRVNTSEPSLKVGLEGHYWNLTDHLMELNVDYVSSDGLTTRRPFGITIDRTTHECTTGFAGTLHSFWKTDIGTGPRVDIDLDAGVSTATLIKMRLSGGSGELFQFGPSAAGDVTTYSFGFGACSANGAWLDTTETKFAVNITSLTPAIEANASGLGVFVSPSHALHIQKSSASAIQALIANNDNTNTASHAKILLSAGGASGGDSFIGFDISGVGSWALGQDNSASDAFVISRAATLGSSNVLSISTGGAVTIPNLAGTGSRTVVADANGVLSAP